LLAYIVNDLRFLVARLLEDEVAQLLLLLADHFVDLGAEVGGIDGGHDRLLDGEFDLGLGLLVGKALLELLLSPEIQKVRTKVAKNA
jgi:hypothetical protein